MKRKNAKKTNEKLSPGKNERALREEDRANFRATGERVNKAKVNGWKLE